MIRRRHVIYVEGYDPQGAEGYYNLFRNSWTRFLKIWPLQSKLGALEIDSDDFAHWDVEATGPNWKTETRYEFLRQEHVIRANMAEPLPLLLYRSLRWLLECTLDGTNYRILRGAWRYGVSLIHFELMPVWWLLLSALGGWLAGWLAARYAGAHWAVSALVGIAAAFVCFKLMHPLAKRWFVIQINSHWPHLLEFVRGDKSSFDRPVEAAAQCLVAAAKANAADEILMIGHSGGCILAPVAMARALELDPDLGRHGPKVVMVTVGSIMPAAAAYSRATALRAAVGRVAVEPSVLWIDTQARKDIMNYWEFDPVKGIGVEVGERQCNPLIWPVTFRDMITPELYRRLRWKFFRVHYQFIMANEQRAPYDYYMLVAGPARAEDWARRGRGMLAAFSEDAAYTEPGAD